MLVYVELCALCSLSLTLMRALRLRLVVIAVKKNVVEGRMQMSLYRTEVYRISIRSVVRRWAMMTKTTTMIIVEMRVHCVTACLAHLLCVLLPSTSCVCNVHVG